MRLKSYNISFFGTTGYGKSSLINALCGAYVAKVSDTKSCTERAQVYQCQHEGRVLMEILDTRGIAESESLNSSLSAEQTHPVCGTRLTTVCSWPGLPGLPG